ncbi:hypothetical protein GCM10007362_22250 [Saccharibacillus endophyticus]|uniref:Uncharacterized protein n=1 Tax=Saccharibacillus endophyticus TaxID=2060666 RepID=A0ABQ1ZU42_9BACL|nr:hypothetical protein GCM10007362_22250 [Saccharibacillus endophyticus]
MRSRIIRSWPGVSGPGVVKRALEDVKDVDLETLCETIKRTAFKVTRASQFVAQEAAKRLGVPFGSIDLSLAPTPAVGDSIAKIFRVMGLEEAGAPGTIARRLSIAAAAYRRRFIVLKTDRYLLQPATTLLVTGFF